MSSRGRGYGGGYSGGYGGRGRGRGSYRGGRGSYESRGGRGGGSYSSYNNDSRYSSSSSTRNSGRERFDDSYKKPFRSESSMNYSTREYGRSGSPERKRMRMEGSSNDRHSHDGGGHYGGSYGSRQDNYGGERRSFMEERRRSPSREGYRKAGGMGPPREPMRSGMRSRAPRRTFRGRTLRSRGSYRGGAPRSRGSYRGGAPRRFPDTSLSYTRAFKSLKSRSPIKSKDGEASSTEEEWDGDEKEDVVEDKADSKSKSPKAELEAEGSEGSAGAAADETDKEPDAGSEPPEPRPRSFLNLTCVHCKQKCFKLSGYARHLVSSRHQAAMTGVARRHKAQLQRMRVAQRDAQRELEQAGGAPLTARSAYCPVCQLYHRTTRYEHNLTDTHRAMKRFLMPFCRICRTSFRSPMLYEHHICSIDHLKRKATQAARQPSPKAEGSGDEGMDVDLDNFMTLDSVGDVDEVEDDDDDSGAEKKEEPTKKKSKSENINIGSEHIKKVEVWYCELCRVYLSGGAGGAGRAGGAGEAEALRRHCRLRAHLGRYVRHRDTRTLRKHAERIHRQLHTKEEEKAEADEETNKDNEEKQENDTGAKKAQENGTDNTNASGSDDKLWADVDKDIGDLLREVDPQGNEASEDDDDLDRYEKFRKSDKKVKSADEGETDDKMADSGTQEKKSIETNTAA